MLFSFLLEDSILLRKEYPFFIQPACEAPRVLLLADSAPTVGWGKTFWRVSQSHNRSEGAKSTSCRGPQTVPGVPKVLLPPLKIRISAPKTAKFGQKLAFFGHFGPNICLSGPSWCYARPMGTRCLVGFLICEYQSFCSLPK